MYSLSILWRSTAPVARECGSKSLVDLASLDVAVQLIASAINLTTQKSIGKIPLVSVLREL